MAKKVVKKPRMKFKLPKIKAKLTTKAYVGDSAVRNSIKVKELESRNDSLVNRIDSLEHENDSLKRIVRVEIKSGKK